MKVGDKVQLRRRISQKGGKTRLATEKVTILGIYPHHVQVRNQKGIVRSYINWEWQQLTSKEGMEGVESWRRSQNELGGATGGQSGDQTGREIWCTNYYNFPWNYVLRLSHSESGGSSG